MALKPVITYEDIIKANRRNYTVDGFDFDVNTFENLIDCWTPKSDIKTILNVSHGQLDSFCMQVYNMNFNDTYDILSHITDAFMRKTMKNLASGGNATAISIVTQHFMKLQNQQSNSVSINFVNDIKSDSFEEIGNGSNLETGNGSNLEGK